MRILISTLILFFFLSGNSQILDKDFVNNRNKKAFEFYQNYLKERNNQVISPFFIDFTFSAIYTATKAGTASQVSDFMIFDKDWNIHSKKFLEYQKIITNNNKLNTYFNYSIDFLIEDTLKVLDNFQKKIAPTIIDSVHYFDFTISKDTLAGILNRYLKSKTSDFSGDFFTSQIIPDKPNILLNSFAYYTGYWANDLKNYVKAPFYVDSLGKTIENVQYLTTFDYYKYGETKEYQIIEIPYEGYELTMIVILPRKIMNLEDFKQIFTFDSYLLWRQKSLQTQQIRLFLPKFYVKSQYTFKSSLDTVIPSIFSFGGNFINLVGKIVKVSEIYHYSQFEVKPEQEDVPELKYVDFNAEQLENESVIFNINRPFIFLLIHRKSEAIIYMGHIYNPFL